MRAERSRRDVLLLMVVAHHRRITDDARVATITTVLTHYRMPTANYRFPTC